MKQIGNLAAICAQRADVLMQIYEGMIAIHLDDGPARVTLCAAWDDENTIKQIICELNHGKYADRNGEK